MFHKTRRGLASLVAVGALAAGGTAIAGAATNTTTTTTPSGVPPSGSGQPPGGRHVGSNGQREQALSADVAAKVKSAAEAKVPGATVLRVETDVDTGSPYEAHMQKSDGSQVVAYVNDSFTVTSVAAFGGPGGPGGAGGAPAAQGSGA